MEFAPPVATEVLYLAAMKEYYGVTDTSLSLSNAFCLKDFRRGELRKFVPRLLVAFIVFQTGLYINNLSQAWLQSKMAGYYQTHWPPNRTLVANGEMAPGDSVVLWDVTFEAFPTVDSTAYADALAGGLPVLFWLRFVVIPGPFSLRWTVLTRFITCWGLLWFCRAFTILVTPLPNPDLTCKPRISFPHNLWREAWAIMPFDPAHNELTCQDVLYSGHTVAITLSVLFIFKYSALSPWFEGTVRRRYCGSLTVVYLIGSITLLIGYYCIIASRFHYTVDVLVGAMMTFMVVQGYHYAIRVVWFPSDPRFTPHNMILQWYEWHAKDLKLFRSIMLSVRVQDHEVRVGPDIEVP
mmetsp:Transcript_82738/g.230733  ORF Transcript_82738/g.230733 Transcript_82738/m.230733 type:complete len:352 (+) Transcript_82738:36-1091(+)